VPGPAAELEALSCQLEASNPELYRHLALYLQVLRETLPAQVEQACFHLVTQLRASRYAELPETERHQLHRRIQTLVRRCCGLLTVDQLAALAEQMQRERRRQHLQEQRQLLRQLQEPEPAHESAPVDLPQGSVQLSMALPLTSSIGSWDLLAPGGAPQGRYRPSAERASADPRADDGFAGLAFPDGSDPGDPSDSNHPGHGSPTGHLADPSGRAEPSDPTDPALLSAMAEACSAALADALLDGALQPPRSGASGTDASGDAEDLGRQGRLPRNPLKLLRWLDGIEQALGRRLRNLSHGLNVEFRRCGITSTLLPVSLLDAVLGGQLETQPGPANLLRLILPFGIGSSAAPETHGLLLRQADLEMEQPRLRTCRRRLHQHRLQVVKMAQQYRRLQRRLQVHQAERLWLQDIRTTQQQQGKEQQHQQD